VSDLNALLRNNPVAIIGMGALMPEAHNLQEFWDNILAKVDCITDVPASRWNIDDYYDPDPTAPDKTYSKRGGFLPDVNFDPLEFGLPPNILEATDASQLLSLLVAKEALIDAGYYQGPEALRDKTGVILGVCSGQKLITPLSARMQYPIWNRVLESYGISAEDRAKIVERMSLAYVGWEENSFPGLLGNVISGRIANRFDLGGTNCSVDAACASTMAALKMALSELTSGQADMMLAGGVDTDNSIFTYMCFSKTPAFTKGTHPRPFDVGSDGMMVGEGIGMMVLKRLADAERDGDKIYAVIKGIGSSSDGRFKSIYAPRGEGQEKALNRAYEDAGISPATIDLIEAHGTGTIAGDTTEVTTIIRFFNQRDTEKQHIAIGSVKSQIGHTKASAGAAGLIKTALALHHKVLPPTLNVEKPNPKYDIENSAFYISGDTRPWIKAVDDAPRRAGVSSFGFGGTNFHVVMEEYTHDHSGSYRVNHTPQAILLQAGTPPLLQTRITEVLENLRGANAVPYFLNLARESATAALPASAARLGFVALNGAEALPFLQIAFDLLTSKPQADEWQHPKGVFYRRSGMTVTGHVVALFAGQGAQYLGMGRELAINFPEVRTTFARLDAVMHRKGKPSLSTVVYPPTAFTEDEKNAQEEALQDTTYAQPAIGAVSAGMYRLLKRAGFRADFTAGHSFGEVSALWAAGVLSDDDYDTLIEARGAAMAPPANAANFDAGTMLAVAGDIAMIEREVALLTGVHIANRNSRTQVVVAGSKADIQKAETALAAKGFKVTPLSVAAAFHTPLVGHAQKPFADVIARTTFQPAQVPVYSNETGAAYPATSAAMQQLLSGHLLKPVRFTDEVEALYAAGGTVFVEFGPRSVLTNLVKDILGTRPHVAIALNGSRQKDSDRQLREAVVQLQVLGMVLSAVDPYQQEVDPTPKKKGMNVVLNAATYVSDKTRAAYQNALASGGTIGLSAPQPLPALPVQPPVAVVQPMPVVAPVAAKVETPAPVVQVAPAAPVSSESSASDQGIDMNTRLHSLEEGFEQFREHQRETLRVHEQYAQSQGEYFRIFFELTQQQQTLMTAQAVSPQGLEAFAQNMMRFHDYQTETLRMHERYMQHQTEIAQSLLEIIRQQYVGLASLPTALNGSAPSVAPQPVSYRAAAPAPVVTRAPVVKAAVDPSVPPQPPMIDPPAPPSISPPTPPMIDPPAPPSIVPPSPPSINPPAPPEIVPPALPMIDPPTLPTSTAPAMAALSEAMLRIVGDKTGYPVEMLDLGMDMEADLGIDSIKRVEILGAMREEFPELPQFSPEELGELRTLQQIVDYMRERAGGSAAPVVASAAPITATVSAPVTAPQNGHVTAAVVAPVPSYVAAQVVAPVAPAPTVAVVADNAPALAALSEAMLRIVGDKTGYPVEMLDLGMDMEADLGIDSIKRVEILGAMREEFPMLPQFSPEELGELRTLQQIVDYMRERAGGSAAPATVPAEVVAVTPVVVETVAPVAIPAVNGHSAPAAAPANDGADLAALSEAMLRIVGDKTGYPVEMLELSMDMEADLGIDSIKRVEILGAMREEFPELPQFSPEELGELRTLQQIVDYMKEASRTSTAAPFDLADSAAQSVDRQGQIDDALSFPPLPDGHGIERRVVTLRGIPLPDFQDLTVAGALCLLTDDGGDVTPALAAQLTADGWRVVVLTLPAALVPVMRTGAGLAQFAQIALPDLSESSLQSALSVIAEQFGAIGAYIHVNGVRTGSANGWHDAEKALVKFNFLMAKHLKAVLTRGNRQDNPAGRKAFVVVTQLDGALATTIKGGAGAITGGLFGLIKTLNLEWNDVFCRAIDVAPTTTGAHVAQMVLAELHDPNRLLTEVAYGAQGRTTLSALEPHTDKDR